MNIYSKYVISLVLPGMLGLPACARTGGAGSFRRSSPLDWPPGAAPILTVTLHAKDHPCRSRAFRFRLDPSAPLTVLDIAVPARFYCEEPGPPPRVVIRRIAVAGMVRDEVAAVRMDLGSGDPARPVDGVLGMSFLRWTRFRLDPGRRRLEWWAEHPRPRVSLPIRYGADHRPRVQVGPDGAEVDCTPGWLGTGGPVWLDFIADQVSFPAGRRLDLPGSGPEPAPRPIEAGAGTPRTFRASGLEFDEDGLPVLNVRLDSLGEGGFRREFRFLLDTGFDLVAVDRSVPAAFLWQDNARARVTDATGALLEAPGLFLKRIEVGGMVRDAVPALRLDLKGSLGPFQDRPVDGILGMSFLRGTRFVLDPGARRVAWWQVPPGPGATLPVAYRDGKTPLVTVTFEGQPVPCVADTGAMGGIMLPDRLRPAGRGLANQHQGLAGRASDLATLRLAGVAAGGGIWRDAEVDFKAGTGAIGQDVWSLAPVCFDFVADRITLAQGPDRRLPLRSKARRTLPVVWDRSGGPPRLKVIGVKPGSALAEAGCRIGDLVLRAGPLRGGRLDRRRLMALVGRGRPHEWIVQRAGRRLRLCLFADGADGLRPPTP
jgi:hypothetical protein